MAEIKEILGELEKVDLVPIIMPALRISDPVMGCLPKGSLESLTSGTQRQDDLARMVEGMVPVMPTLIRFLGNVSQSKVAAGVLSICASVSTPFVKLLAPILAKFVVASVGPCLRIVNGLSPLLPPTIRAMDRLIRTELFLERPLKRVVPSWWHA